MPARWVNLQVKISQRGQTGSGLKRRCELSSHAKATSSGCGWTHLIPCASCKSPRDVANDALPRGAAAELPRAAGIGLVPDLFLGVAPVRTTRQPAAAQSAAAADRDR